MADRFILQDGSGNFTLQDASGELLLQADALTIVEDASDGWFAGTIKCMVPVAAALALATAATTAQAQAVANQSQDEVYQVAQTQGNPYVWAVAPTQDGLNVPAPWRWHVDELPSATVTIVEENGYTQPPPVWWAVAALPPVDPDQLSFVTDEDGYTAPPPAVAPIIRLDQGWPQDERAPILDDGTGTAPRVPSGPALTLWVHRPSGGYSTVPFTAIAADEGEPPLWPLRLVLPVMVSPWAGLPDELPAFWLNEEPEYQVTVPPAPAPVVLPQTLYQPDERVTPPAGFGLDDSDVGGGPYVYVGPRYRVLLPPPKGGYSTPSPPTMDEGEYQAPPPAVWTPIVLPQSFYQAEDLVDIEPPFWLDEDAFVAAPLGSWADPTFYVDTTEATPWLLTEDHPGPLPVVPWGVRVPAPWIWAQDERGTAAAPLAIDEGTFPVPLPPVAAPVVLPQPQGNDDRPLFIFVDDYTWSPRVRTGPGLTVWVHKPSGGYSTLTVAIDEGEWPVPAPWPVPILSAPVWLNEDRIEPPAAFALSEDMDPSDLWRALPPVWRAQRTPIAFWEVEESRVPPVTASGAHGTGRTHLFVGQVSNDATPQSAAAALYVLTGGYGTPAGDDTALLIETPDIAPLGPAGRVRFRRMALPVQYDAACTLRVTPIVDYGTALAATLVTLNDPGEVTRAMVQAKYLTACTTIRFRIEVLDRHGPVEVYRPSIFFSPLSGGTTMAMGGQP